MMFRLFSDIHLDFDAGEHENPVPHLWQPIELPEDLESTLLLAGDLWVDNRPFKQYEGVAWIELVAKRFKHVVLILGNHDYWHGSLDRAPDKAKESITKLGLTNVHLLERDTIVIDNVKIVGTTLWTSFNKGHPLVLYQAGQMMNDYHQMTVGTGQIRRKCKPQDVYNTYLKSYDWLTKAAKRDTPGQGLLIMTHMAPSYQSINEMYRVPHQETMNFLYYSDLDYTVLDIAADVWVHGHTHVPRAYMIGATHVMCNPRGYAGHEDTGYNPRMQFSIEADMPVASDPVFFSPD